MSDLMTYMEALSRLRRGEMTRDEAHLWFAEQVKAGRALPRGILHKPTPEITTYDLNSKPKVVTVPRINGLDPYVGQSVRKVDCQNEGSVTAEDPDSEKIMPCQFCEKTVPCPTCAAHVALYKYEVGLVSLLSDCMPCTPDDEPEPPRASITDDEREATLRKDYDEITDYGPDKEPVDDIVFLLRRLDELRASIAPAPAPAHNWIARLNGPFVPPA